jgi:hypothetical protein
MYQRGASPLCTHVRLLPSTAVNGDIGFAGSPMSM